MDHASKGLLAGISIDALRHRTTVEPYKKLWSHLVAGWRDMAAREAAAPNYLNYGSLGSHGVTPCVIDAGLIYALTGDAAALTYVERCIGHLAKAYGTPEERQRVAKSAGGSPPYHAHYEVPLAADLCRAGLSPAARETLCRVLREHVIGSHDHGQSLHMFSAGGNIPTARNLNVAIAALTWGEDAGHPDWRGAIDNGRDVCLGYFRRGLDARGYPFEGPGYSAATAHHLYLFAQLLKQRGTEDLFALEPNTCNYVDALLSLLFPDRSSLGNINDLGLLSPFSLPFLPLTARYFNRPDHLGFWYEFQGPDHPARPYGDALDWFEGRYDAASMVLRCLPPSALLAFLWWDAEAPAAPLTQTRIPTALHSPGQETSVFRTSWSTTATFASFLGSGRSHLTHGHHHADCGHFALFAHGEYLAIDTGRYNADEDQHNVVLVDGKCHLPNRPNWGSNMRSGRIHSFQRHNLLDYAVADMAHMKNCIWADRHLLFVRTGGDDAYLVTLDNLNVDNAKHSFWWQLHTQRGFTIDIAGQDRAAIHAPMARLDIEFVIPGREDFPTDPHRLALRTDEMTWDVDGSISPEVHDKGDLQTTSTRRPRLVAELTGLNGILLAVLSPRRPAEPPRIVRRTIHRRVMRIDIEMPTFTDTLYAAPDCGYINLPEIKAFSELVLLRRSKTGSVIDRWTSNGLAPERLAM